MGEHIEQWWKESVGEGWDWLKQVILGEFDDHQSTSAIVAQLLVSFVPGVVVVMSVRDMTAVIMRMHRRPQLRHEVTEWMIVVACALGIVPAIAGVVVGSAGTLIGTAIGGLAGDEAGAALRATCILLIEDGTRMLEKLVEFLRRFVKGDIVRFLREVKFVKYTEPVIEEFGKFIRNMIGLTEKLIAKANEVRWIGKVGEIIETLRNFERGLRAIDEVAAKQITSVLKEFDERLARALSKPMTQAEHVVHPHVPAPRPPVHPVEPRRVVARADTPLGKAEGLEHPNPLPPKVKPEENLHPQGVEAEPAAKAEDMRAAKIAETKKNLKLRADLDNNYFDDNGGLHWPDDDGALDGWHDAPLQPNDVIDRYGDPKGKYSSPVPMDADGNLLEGESYDSRALPYDQDQMDYHQYRVLQTIPNRQSIAAPSFDQPGMAIQNYHAPISDLLRGDNPSLEEITPSP